MRWYLFCAMMVLLMVAYQLHFVYSIKDLYWIGAGAGVVFYLTSLLGKMQMEKKEKEREKNGN